MADKFGYITQVIGPVVDVAFEGEGNDVPPIYAALKIERENGADLIVEVEHITLPSGQGLGQSVGVHQRVKGLLVAEHTLRGDAGPYAEHKASPLAVAEAFKANLAVVIEREAVAEFVQVFLFVAAAAVRTRQLFGRNIHGSFPSRSRAANRRQGRRRLFFSL